jgi:hypothetical protein
MELYIIRAETDPLAQEAEIEVGVVAGTADQTMRLVSGYYLPKRSCFQCEETNVAVDPPARVIGWFDHGRFIAAEMLETHDSKENTPIH